MFCLLSSSLSDTWYFKWFVAGVGLKRRQKYERSQEDVKLN